jgi:hypothetical protein
LYANAVVQHYQRWSMTRSAGGMVDESSDSDYVVDETEWPDADLRPAFDILANSPARSFVLH